MRKRLRLKHRQLHLRHQHPQLHRRRFRRLIRCG
jgi:hypothetical protein